METSMSDLDRFELFTYVAQCGSLTQAATALGISKPSLSKQIKRLETDLKVDLFSRTAYRLQLTEQGEILFAQCLRLRKELDDARSICQGLIDEPEGTLRVVAFEYFSERLIFPKLKSFMNKYPKLDIIIDTNERMPNFEKEQVDIAVGFSLSSSDDIVRKRIEITRFVLCASPEYFNKHGRPSELSDLKKHAYIEHSGRAPSHRNELHLSRTVAIKPILMLNSVVSMIECAKQGIGLIQLPLYLLDSELKQGNLVEVLSEGQPQNINVYYYYPRYRYTQPKIRKFIDFFF